MLKCADCDEPAKENRKCCPRHLALRAAASRRHVAKDPERFRRLSREWNKRWQAAHRDHLAQYAKRRRANFTEEQLARDRANRARYVQANRDKILAVRRAAYWKDPERYRLYSRARRYGISVEELKSLLMRTHCELCGCQFGGKELMQHVDHDHKTGKVRGVLCHRCNTMLGKLEESLELIEKFAAYVRKYSL